MYKDNVETIHFYLLPGNQEMLNNERMNESTCHWIMLSIVKCFPKKFISI